MMADAFRGASLLRSLAVPPGSPSPGSLPSEKAARRDPSSFIYSHNTRNYGFRFHRNSPFLVAAHPIHQPGLVCHLPKAHQNNLFRNQFLLSEGGRLFLFWWAMLYEERFTLLFRIVLPSSDTPSHTPSTTFLIRYAAYAAPLSLRLWVNRWQRYFRGFPSASTPCKADAKTGIPPGNPPVLTFTLPHYPHRRTEPWKGHPRPSARIPCLWDIRSIL